MEEEALAGKRHKTMTFRTATHAQPTDDYLELVRHFPLVPIKGSVHLKQAFDVIDELYLSEMHGENRMLLHTHFNGIAQTGFVEADWFGDERRAVLYLHAHGAGAVLYNTLGHCRGKYDMQPLIEEYPAVERCAWMRPEYHELLERGIRWMARLDSEPPEGR